MQWRDGLLVLITLFLGPAIASLVAALGMAAVHDGGIGAFSLASYGALLSLAYVVGWIPMVAAGVANAVLSRHFATTGRLLLALPVGFAAVAMMFALVAGNLGGGYLIGDLLIFSLGGAFAAHLSVAIVELFGPKLRAPGT